jgi:hypothetical protein
MEVGRRCSRPTPSPARAHSPTNGPWITMGTFVGSPRSIAVPSTPNAWIPAGSAHVRGPAALAARRRFEQRVCRVVGWTSVTTLLRVVAPQCTARAAPVLQRLHFVRAAPALRSVESRSYLPPPQSVSMQITPVTELGMGLDAYSARLSERALSRTGTNIRCRRAGDLTAFDARTEANLHCRRHVCGRKPLSCSRRSSSGSPQRRSGIPGTTTRPPTTRTIRGMRAPAAGCPPGRDSRAGKLFS